MQFTLWLDLSSLTHPLTLNLQYYGDRSISERRKSNRFFFEKKAAQPLFNWNRLFNPFQSSPLFSFSRLCVSSAIWPRPWFSISDNFNSILKIRNCQRQKFNPWKIWICLKNEIVSRAISLPGWLWFSISDISIQYKKIETPSSKDCNGFEKMKLSVGQFDWCPVELDFQF